MKRTPFWRFTALLIVAAMALSACATATQTPTTAPTEPAAPVAEPTQASVEEPTQAPAVEEPTAAPTTAEAEPFTFGMLLVGPYNDHGWSNAHYDAGLYVEEKLPGSKMIYIDKVNTADRPGTTAAQLGEDLLNQGAQAVIFNSDDMQQDAAEFAKNHPDIPVIFASGDTVWEEGENYQDLPNMSTPMGRMEYGKMMAGCAAALTSETGKIGYLGPLINDETRRLTASAFLGARYCWETYAEKDPADLAFKVTWIGFWFNIPGFTSDPTQVADEFFNSGYDVVISGIDTTEGLVEAGKMAEAGKKVWAVPYDYKSSCQENEAVCLGVPYFNWGPTYLETFQSILDGTYESTWSWLAPDWSDINNPDTSPVGFVKGDALSEEASADLDAFIAELGGGLNLWTGPLNLQDGTEFLAEGVEATDQQIWYLPALLEGMEGQSVSE